MSSSSTSVEEFISLRFKNQASIRFKDGADAKSYEISIFDFPEHLLPCYNDTTKQQVHQIVNSASEDKRGLTCRTCCLVFEDRSDQGSHFSSELHRSNLKRSFSALPPLLQAISIVEGEVSKEEENECLVDGAEERRDKGEKRIVEKEEDDDEEEEDEEVLRLERQLYAAEVNLEYSSSSYARHLIECAEGLVRRYNHALLGASYGYRFGTSSWELSISSAIIEKLTMEGKTIADTDPWQKLIVSIRKNLANPLWCVMLLQSGRFAITVFEGSSPLLHRVFRHYTVRAKAGGSQSSHDNKGKNAKSAGATLRRQGEQSLKDDIKSVLKEWKYQLKECAVVLTVIPKHMKHIVFDDGRDTPLHRNDPRVRSIPFMVGKPTFAETVRVHEICSKVIFSTINPTPVTLSTSSSASVAAVASDITEVVKDKGKLTRNEESHAFTSDPLALLVQAFDPPSESIELCRACRSCNIMRVRDLLASLTAELTPMIEEADESDESYQRNIYSSSLTSMLSIPESIEDLQTPLHISSESGDVEIVALLLTHGADPTILDVHSRSAYYMAKDKETRDIFRRCRGLSGMEERWNWDTAGVPSAITDELINEKKEKEKEKKRKMKERKKVQKEKEQREAIERKAREEADAKRMAEEKVAKILSFGDCATCQVALYGTKVFDVFDRRCCSTVCVGILRRKLAAEAAEKRLGGCGK